MPKDEDWIDERLSNAKKAHSSVTDGAASRMRDLLKNQLGERHLRPMELAKLAEALIADMGAPAGPKVEASHED